MRELAADVDPTLRVGSPMPLPAVIEDDVQFNEFWFRMLVAITVIAIGLSFAGIYARALRVQPTEALRAEN